MWDGTFGEGRAVWRALRNPGNDVNAWMVNGGWGAGAL